MKKLIALAACVTLAACNNAETEAPTDDTATMTTGDAPAPMAADSMAGTYDATYADGRVTSTTIDDQGGYVTMENGAEIERGTVVETNGQTCYNSAAEGAAPKCWTQGEPAQDGSFIATSDDGEQITVTPNNG